MLIDFESMNPLFERVFGEKRVLREWLGHLIMSPPTPRAKSPLENADLDHFFERQVNIETARAYKPAPIVYHMVALELDVPPSA